MTLVPITPQPAVSDREVLAAFLADQDGLGAAYGTVRRRAVAAFARFLPCSLVEATAEHVGMYVNRPLAPSSRATILVHLNAFYQWALDRGLVDASPVEPFRGYAADKLTLAPSTSIDVAGEHASVCLVQVSPAVELYRVTLELGVCGGCGDQDDRLRRLGGIGAPLCRLCYQRAKRAARKAGETLQAAARRTTAGDLRSELLARGLAPRSITQYMHTIWSAERWFDAQGWSLARATPEQIVAYANTKPLTTATRHMLKCALRHYWDIAGHHRPPLGAIRVPVRQRGTCQALEEDEARLLAATARARRDREGVAVLLGLYQGMRREEIATLPWTAFDAAEDGGHMTITGKGSKQRTIPVHDVVREAIGWVKRTSNPYIFVGKHRGCPVGPSTVWHWVRVVAESAGLDPVRCHQLRHTALSTMNDTTGDLRTVQYFAGHAKPETTSGYTRVTDRRLRAAVAALDY